MKILLTLLMLLSLESRALSQPLNSETCDNLGYRWANCAALAMKGKKCPAKDNFPMPERCKNDPKMKVGMERALQKHFPNGITIDKNDIK